MSFRNAKNPIAMRLWRVIGWSGCAAATVALTVALMGQWPSREHAPVRGVAQWQSRQQSDLDAQASPPASRVGLKATALPEPASSTRAGIDVLARLESAGRAGSAAQTDARNFSDSLDDALQRALAFPDFGALAGRSDAEGLFEAAAWADACERNALPAQETALRCREPDRHGPNYADELLRQAADAGQPGAVLALATRHPDQWMEIPLRSGAMLGDRVFTLAALGRSGALALLSQFCAVPNACVDDQLTRNVLALLQLSRFKTGTLEVDQYLSGPDTTRRAAQDRAAQIRAQLQWPP
nr:hypothetical protein HUO10_005829 [Paraburkholderia busanensis]